MYANNLPAQRWNLKWHVKKTDKNMRNFCNVPQNVPVPRKKSEKTKYQYRGNGTKNSYRA